MGKLKSKIDAVLLQVVSKLLSDKSQGKARQRLLNQQLATDPVASVLVRLTLDWTGQEPTNQSQSLVDRQTASDSEFSIAYGEFGFGRFFFAKLGSTSRSKFTGVHENNSSFTQMSEWEAVSVF